jgi:branched-chain amino acid transport system substrate-binding protein
MRIPGLVSALAVAGLLSACGGGSGSAAADGKGPIVIGSHVPITGPASFVGQGFEVGAQLAQKEINAHGGIDGRQLKLEFVDDKGTTDGALTAVRQLLTRDKALAILGGSTSTATLGAVPYFRQNPDALYYVSLASDPRVLEGKNKNIFVGSALSQADGVKIYADHLQKTVKAKRVAIMLCDQGHCISGGPLLDKELKGRGIEVVSTTTFNSGDTDFTGQVQQVKKSDPDAVFVFALPADGGRLLPQLRRAGVSVPLAGDISLAHEIVPKVAGKDAEGFEAFFQAGTTLLTDTSGPMATWRASLEKNVSKLPEGTPNSYSLQAYSDTYALAEAIRAAGKAPTSKQVIASLETDVKDFVPGKGAWDYAEPVSFPRTFSADDHQGNRRALPVRVQNGVFVKVQG